MRACIYDNILRKVSIKDIPMPLPKKNEVLVKVRACGICGSDLVLFRWPKSPYRMVKELYRSIKNPYRIIIGHEIAGDTVEESISTKRVVIYPKVTCGECYYCRHGMENLCVNAKSIGKDLPGGCAEYVVVPLKNIVELPSHITYEEATLIEPLGAAYHAISMQEREFRKVAILGAGTMGLLTLQLLRILKVADEIFVVEPIELKRKIAVELGADVALTPSEALLRLREIDAVFECVGGYAVEKTINLALNLVKARGRIVLLGSVAFSPKVQLGTLHVKEVSITGSWTLTFNDFRKALELASQGKIKLKPLITHVFPLTDIDKAIKVALSSQAIKVVVKP